MIICNVCCNPLHAERKMAAMCVFEVHMPYTALPLIRSVLASPACICGHFSRYLKLKTRFLFPARLTRRPSVARRKEFLLWILPQAGAITFRISFILFPMCNIMLLYPVAQKSSFLVISVVLFFPSDIHMEDLGASEHKKDRATKGRYLFTFVSRSLGGCLWLVGKKNTRK